MYDHLPILVFPSSKAPTAPLETDSPSDPGDKMFLQVFLNLLQSEYATLVNPAEMSISFRLQKVSSASRSCCQMVCDEAAPRVTWSSGAAIRRSSRGGNLSQCTPFHSLHCAASPHAGAIHSRCFPASRNIF